MEQRSPFGLSEHLERISKIGDPLEERHRALAPLFGTGIGFHLLGLEGEITLATLSLAEEAGLSVLPVHDCCLCPFPDADAVKAIMEEAYRRVAKTGDCPVVVP
jgi:hypothetical protein